MKERPILFSAPMVRAILEGRKTQTRRVVTKANSLRDGSSWHKSQPFDAHDWAAAWIDGGPSPAGNVGPYLKVPFHEDDTVHRVYPKWSVQDQLWVKETHSVGWVRDAIGGTGKTLSYRADDRGLAINATKWRPSIFMPRWASRIQLEIAGVRVERLHHISASDALAEGITLKGGQGYDGWAEAEYAALWESINGAGSWAANPWVWVVEFRRVQK